MAQINNGQSCPASFDLYDQKDKVFEELPEGSTCVITGGDAGGPTGVAQWVPDSDDPAENKGTITTEGDNVGSVTFTATLTLPDGSQMVATIPLDVVHSAPGSFSGSLGTPVDE